jgi:5,10-methylenetetrahydromethanopterin reductase
MPQLQLGLGLFPTEPPRRIVEVTKLAEDLGYDHVWMGDSQLIWREVYVTLGAAGLATERITLGQGVTNPLTRHATVTASALATLAELTGGRVALGIGAGDSSVETFGGRPATMARLESTVRTIGGLLAGERVDVGTGEARLDWAQPMRVPVYIAGSGPKILGLAGKIADGAIILVGTAPEQVQAAIACIQEAGRDAGRDLDAEGFQYVLWAPCAISDDGVAARDFVKSHVARVLKRPLPFAMNAEDQAVVDEVYRRYEYYDHMVVGAKHSDIVPDRIVRKFAIAGTIEECREQVAELAQRTSLHQIAIIPHTPDPADRAALVRTFAERVARP